METFTNFVELSSPDVAGIMQKYFFTFPLIIPALNIGMLFLGKYLINTHVGSFKAVNQYLLPVSVIFQFLPIITLGLSIWFGTFTDPAFVAIGTWLKDNLVETWGFLPVVTYVAPFGLFLLEQAQDYTNHTFSPFVDKMISAASFLLMVGTYVSHIAGLSLDAYYAYGWQSTNPASWYYNLPLLLSNVVLDNVFFIINYFIAAIVLLIAAFGTESTTLNWLPFYGFVMHAITATPSTLALLDYLY